MTDKKQREKKKNSNTTKRRSTLHDDDNPILYNDPPYKKGEEDGKERKAQTLASFRLPPVLPPPSRRKKKQKFELSPLLIISPNYPKKRSSTYFPPYFPLFLLWIFSLLLFRLFLYRRMPRAWPGFFISTLLNNVFTPPPNAFPEKNKKTKKRLKRFDI